MAISPLSFSRGAMPKAYQAAWTALHTSYTEIASDASYIESDRDWSGSHFSYGEVFIPTPEAEPAAPDLKTLQALVNAPENRNLDSAILNWNVSSAGLNLTLQRDSSPDDQAVPLSATSLHLSVLGTNVAAWESFPMGSRTVNLTLPGIPPGIHTLEVEAYANGRSLGTTRLTVTIQGPTKQQADPIVPNEPPLQTVAPRQGVRPSSHHLQAAPAPKRELNPTRRRQPSTTLPPAAREEPPTSKPQAEQFPALVRIGEAYLGQAMASGLGRGSLSLSGQVDDGTHESIQAIGAIRKGGLEGHGSHRPPWPTAKAEVDEPEGIIE